MVDYHFRVASKIAVLAFAAIFLSSCSHCFANAGISDDWAIIIHFFIGNAFIGLLEGLLIAKCFGIKFWRAALLCVLMVIANYVSSVAGSFCTFRLAHTLIDKYNLFDHLHTLPTVFWGLVALLIVITFLIEWPFVLFGFPPGKGRLRKSLFATLLAQSCSYGLLIPFYAMLSPHSLVTESKFSQSLDFSKNKNAYVYFLGNDEDHNLYRARLDGSKPECIFKKVPAGMDAICTNHNKDGWLICAFDDQTRSRSVEPLLKILNPTATRLDGYLMSHNYTVTNFNGHLISGSNTYGAIQAAIVDLTSPPPPDIDQDLETQSPPTWDIYWANDDYGTGIYIGPWKLLRSKKDEYYLGLNTPVFHLGCEHVSLLPGDQLVFDISEGFFSKQDIVIYDLHSKKLASVALGHSPIVLLDGATEAFTGKLSNEKDAKPY
jgi:hypothetical protein